MNNLHQTPASDNATAHQPGGFVSLDEAQAPTASACCGGPAKTNVSACCSLDEQKKSEGQAGCGCGTRSRTGTTTSRATSTCCA